VDPIARPIALKDKGTRSLGTLRVILNHDGCRDTVNQLSDEDAVLSELVVPVGGDPDFPALDEGDDPTKSIAHTMVRFARWRRREPAARKRKYQARYREAMTDKETRPKGTVTSCSIGKQVAARKARIGNRMDHRG